MSAPLAFVFSGIGTQWPGMARELLATDAAFLTAVEELDTPLRSALQGRSVLELLREEEGPLLDRMDVAHATLFALQFGLTRSFAARGVRPAMVIGHSGGEVAAAMAAGVLTLADAQILIAAQCELIRGLAHGAMLAVAADRATLQPYLAGTSLELAVLNSADSSVVAGPAGEMATLEAALTAAHIGTRGLDISVQFHTRAVDPLLPGYRAALAGLRPQLAQRPVYSALRGGLAQPGDFDADYWCRHVREPADFAGAARAMLAAGAARLVELSAHPVLLHHLAALAQHAGLAPECEATLQRGQGQLLWEPAQPAPTTAGTIDAADALQAALEHVLGVPCRLAEIAMLSWGEIGCASLQLGRLMARLGELLGRRLSVTLPYRHPTPQALLAALTQADAPATATPAHSGGGPDPVAVIGMACRMPGAAGDLEAFWELLSQGADPVIEVPAERWPAADYYDPSPGAPGRGVSRWGGFIASQDLRTFDAKHFRMTPREASALDPQQRLLLEVTWEALENAGLAPAALKGRRVGVYVGICTDDYKNANLYREVETLDTYAGAGSLACTASGRLSYFFGWEGPNFAIDTACSSSLVALHVACQALRAGECDYSVVGGVNAMLTPQLHVFLSKAGILSPTGRCHVFDAAADGYVRAEGCGMLVLQREPDALAAGRRVRARVLGTALNQDGASSSFSTPNGAAQRDLLRLAWAQAGVGAADLGYLEAHGTGTAVGDPIELEALAEALGSGRTPDDPLAVGSVKSNLGHLEAAAGVAAFIKVVLALEHGALPGNLHLREPNPRLDWQHLPLRVVDRTQPWPARGGRRIAGISSFGFSGTNAHAVLEGAPGPAPGAPARATQVLCLAAPDQASLRHLAQRTARRGAALDAAAFADLACATHAARAGLASRVAAAGTPAEVAAELQRWAGAPADSACTFAGEGAAGPLVFAFTGQGCQSPGMAAALYRTEPVFRAVIDRCEAHLQATAGRGIRALLLDALADAATLAAGENAQPAIYAVQCALVELLASWGLRPDRVVGHSVGEFAAGYAAGVLTLEAGLALVARRGALMAAAPGGGAMAAVAVDEATARRALGAEAAQVAVAAVNGPRAVVLSGPPQALNACLARLGAPGARARMLKVSHAFHSPAMAGAAQAFAAGEPPAQAAARMPWISTVDGRDLAQQPPDMAYWGRQIAEPVRFDAALQALEAAGCSTFLEIGPAAVLALLGRDRAGAARHRWIATQDRSVPGDVAIARALAALAALGHTPDWAAWDDPAGRRPADLPAYPFQRKLHWRAPALPRVAPANGASARHARPYDWLNRYALARLERALAAIDAVQPRWQRHLASCRALLAQAPPAQEEARWAQERAAFVQAHPTLTGTLELVEDCIAHYPAIAAGRADPLTILFPQGRLDRVEAVYAHNEVQDARNAQLAALAAAWCAERAAAAPGTPLRIVEVGAGTGAATGAVLAALPAGIAVDYLFTDIGAAFLARARQRFPGLRFAPLDIERPPQEQGLPAGSADLVIANNVLHATADIPLALAHVRALAAPGARLLLSEQTGLQPFIHLVFGLTEGWWRFRDALRAGGSSPLLPAQGWLAALQAAGFSPQPLPDDDGADHQAIFVADVTIQEGPTMADARSAGAAQPALEAVRALVCELTGLAAAELDIDASLMDLGVDSLMLMQLKTLLAARVGIEVEMADFYGDLDTVAKLAAAAPATAGAVAPAAVPLPAPMAILAAPQQAAATPTPAALPALSVPPSAGGELARLLAQQVEAMSRLMSEQNALLAGAATATAAVPAPAVPASPSPSPSPLLSAPAAQRSAAPNFRSMRLEPDALTAAQQAFVDDLARRYAARTPSSKSLADSSRGPLADWKNTLSFRRTLKEMNYPIVAARSQGSHFTDLDGNDFLDLTMGCGIALLGHSPACVTEALHAQVDAGFAIGPQTALAAEVAERFTRLTGMERATFCNTGAEAVMMAVRLARARTGRRKLVVFTGAYHGTWDGILGAEHQGEVHPIGPGIPPGMVEDLVVLNYGTDEALASLRAIAHEVAGVLVEGVQSRRPGFQPVAFLRELRAITQQAGAALILDEIITGLRIGPGGCQERVGIRADLATYGKVVGGGMPMSVVAGSADYMAAVDGGAWRFGDESKPEAEVIYFGGTYAKHPLALAAARAALAHIEALGKPAYEALEARTARMAGALNSWFETERLPLQVTLFGSMFRIDGTGRYSGMMQPIELDLLFLLINLRGVYVWERRICFLSFAHTDAEIDQVIRCVQDAVRELRAGGFGFGLPAPAAAAGPRVGPASSAQRRLFALDHIAGPNVVYNVPLAVHLRGDLDVARLEAAVAQLVARHPALRTRFAVTDEGLEQHVAPGADVALERDDVPAGGIDERLAASVRPFDLGRAPLLRALLLRVEATHHVLAIDAHHIVADGLSLNIMAREVMAAYAGEALAPITADMIEFARAEAAWLASPACRADAQWWQAQFDPLPEPLALPADRPRPAQKSHRGDDLFAVLDAAATARLKAAARAHRMPVFPLALALYAALLHQACAQDDLVIGLPVGGRAEPRWQGTVGMFAATLPLRMRGDAARPLADAARAAHRLFLQALEHQAHPLEALIAALPLPRDTSRNPLFDTMFIYEDGNERVYRMPGLACAPAAVARHAAMFDFCMEVVEAEGALALRCEYDTDLFEPATAQALLDAYVALLRAAPDRMEAPLASLGLADDAQLAAVAAWGDGGPAPEPRTVLDLFDAQLQRAPGAEAVRAGGTGLSYAQLDAWSRRLAGALRAHGPLAPDTPVALLARRDGGLVAGMLAILRAGAAYVPLDADHPPERLRLILQASGCRLALVAPDRAASLPADTALRVVALDEALGAPLQDTPATPVPRHLANIIFTSGSTGTPKGVMVEHRNLAAFFQTLPATFGFAPGQRLLAITTPGFDIAGLELLGALCCGMTVVVASEQEAADSAQWPGLLASEGVEVLQLTPTRLRLLVQATGARPPAGVRTVLVGGEALPQDLADTLSSWTGISAFNVYGPTETTIWSSAWRIAAGPPAIGRPLPGERLFVLSPTGQAQPAGLPGEIAIAGVGVARGYLGDPRRTAERFVTLPGVDGPVYLTGDLGRWRADGALACLGRRDDQVKLRGLRIEIGEIEHRLLQLPGVREAAAGLRENTLGETELVAWLVGTDCETQTAAWRAELARWLPPAMVPSRFMAVDALPRNASGKTDRRALPAPPAAGGGAEARAPQGALEAAIAGAFGDVLGRPIAADDDFFLCGGESIRALRLAGRLRALGLAFELRDLFRWPTPARLAEHLVPLAEPDAAPDALGALSGLAAGELEDLLA
jgi:amino acid adenylation domain-containing protein